MGVGYATRRVWPRAGARSTWRASRDRRDGAGSRPWRHGVDGLCQVGRVGDRQFALQMFELAQEEDGTYASSSLRRMHVDRN